MKALPNAVLRKMGYTSDSHGIINRYINVGGAWDEHLNYSKEFILRVIKGKGIERLAVYGSGWLLDFPLDEIAAEVNHTWLFDIVHPSQIIHKLKKYTNVTAVTADLTGGAIAAAYEAVIKFKTSGIITAPESFSEYTFKSGISCNYAISLNILSQLGDLIVDYLASQIPYNEEEINTITGLLQQSHLRLLQKTASCLITDTSEMQYDSADKLVSTKNLIRCSLPDVAESASWEWHFDPLFEYHPGIRTISQVKAFEFQRS